MRDYDMVIYRYALTGKIHNSDRYVTAIASAPSGITYEEYQSKVDQFKKAFTIINEEYTS